MDDLVKRLRSVPPCNGCGEYPGGDIAQIMDIAAARIEALERQVKAADALADWAKAISERKASPVTGGRLILERDIVGLEASLAAYRATKEGGA